MTNNNLHQIPWKLPGLSMILLGITLLVSGCGPEIHSFAADVKNTLFAPRFGFFIINYPLMNSDSSESVLYARIRYDDVVFVKTDSGFSSHYQFSINVFADKELTEIRYSKILDRKITVPSYAMTNSITAFDTIQDKVTLEPGRYYIVLKLYDYNTDHTSSREIDHTFKNFLQSPLTISDVVLYDQSDSSGVPVDVVKSRGGVLLADFFVTMKDAPARFSLQAVAKSVESPTAIDTTMEIRQAGNVQKYKLPIETDALAAGTYQLKLTVKKDNEVSSSQTIFRVLRSDIPLVPAELDRELEPLIYITTPSQIASMKEGDFKERRAKFLDFWLARANGNKEAAEAMRSEFYSRVDFANQHFSEGLGHGWRSDRGRIFIMYGRPDQVETHDEDFTTPPYQIWYYYNLKLEFVFLDEFATGDYRLVQSSQMD